MNRGIWMGLAMSVLLAAPAVAQEKTDCALIKFSDLPITTLTDGRFTVPVTVEGRVLNFLVDTGGVSATMTGVQAFNLGLTILPTTRELRGVAKTRLNRFARVKNFSLGRLQGVDIPVYVDHYLPAGADGTLSPDMMKQFDVDIDLARGTLSLFSQKHCPGKVVHWTRSGYVVLPMTVASRSGHIEVPVTVDGKKFVALLDTGARHSIISMRAAKALGISENSPDLKLVSDADTEYKRYDYPFKVLGFDGVSVSRPRLEIVSDNFLPGRDTDMIIGNSILRRLHLYIAYGEEKLYITPALAN